MLQNLGTTRNVPYIHPSHDSILEWWRTIPNAVCDCGKFMVTLTYFSKLVQCCKGFILCHLLSISENKMLFTYLIKRTDLKISLYVNKVEISFFYSSMLCWYFPLMTTKGS